MIVVVRHRSHSPPYIVPLTPYVLALRWPLRRRVGGHVTLSTLAHWRLGTGVRGVCHKVCARAPRPAAPATAHRRRLTRRLTPDRPFAGLLCCQSGNTENITPPRPFATQHTAAARVKAVIYPVKCPD